MSTKYSCWTDGARWSVSQRATNFFFSLGDEERDKLLDDFQHYEGGTYVKPFFDDKTFCVDGTLNAFDYIGIFELFVLERMS